jgi:hypothetical protein
MINGRVTLEQLEWLEQRAVELGGNLSAALRQTITDARLLEMARADYRDLLAEHPRFRFPRHEKGASRGLELLLTMELTDTGDEQLRRTEASDEA